MLCRGRVRVSRTCCGSTTTSPPKSGLVAPPTLPHSSTKPLTSSRRTSRWAWIIQGHTLHFHGTRLNNTSSYKDTRIQGCLFVSDINMSIEIWLCDVPLTRKHYLTNTSVVINNRNLNYEHVKLIQALIYPSAPTHSWHTNKHTQFCTDRHPHHAYSTYDQSTPAGK